MTMLSGRIGLQAYDMTWKYL